VYHSKYRQLCFFKYVDNIHVFLLFNILLFDGIKLTIRFNSAMGSYTFHPFSWNISVYSKAKSRILFERGNAYCWSFSNTSLREWFSCLWANRRLRMSLQNTSMPYAFSPLDEAPPTFSMRETYEEKRWTMGT